MEAKNYECVMNRCLDGWIRWVCWLVGEWVGGLMGGLLRGCGWVSRRVHEWMEGKVYA